MNPVRKSFLIAAIVSVLSGGVGAVYMRILELQARQALPPQHRNPQAIYQNYDNAVCLGCSFGEIIFPTLGLALGLLILIVWLIYEAISRSLKKNGQVKDGVGPA